MNNSLFYQLKDISENNFESKKDVREEHLDKREREYEQREDAMDKAASELYTKLIEDGLERKMRERANDGYFDSLIFAVALESSMNDFCTHERNNPYITTIYEGIEYTFTYRSLFWNKKWKELFSNFRLNYKWNKPQTLLSVYISWS